MARHDRSPSKFWKQSSLKRRPCSLARSRRNGTKSVHFMLDCLIEPTEGCINWSVHDFSFVLPAGLRPRLSPFSPWTPGLSFVDVLFALCDSFSLYGGGLCKTTTPSVEISRRKEKMRPVSATRSHVTRTYPWRHAFLRAGGNWKKEKSRETDVGSLKAYHMEMLFFSRGVLFHSFRRPFSFLPFLFISQRNFSFVLAACFPFFSLFICFYFPRISCRLFKTPLHVISRSPIASATRQAKLINSA